MQEITKLLNKALYILNPVKIHLCSGFIHFHKDNIGKIRISGFRGLQQYGTLNHMKLNQIDLSKKPYKEEPIMKDINSLNQLLKSLRELSFLRLAC